MPARSPILQAGSRTSSSHAALACLAAALLAAACSATEGSPLGMARARVIGGASSDAQVASSTVALVFDSSGFCSGVLVAPTIVLTAASCLDPTARGVADQAAVTLAARVLIDADDLTTASSGQFVAAAATMVHPQYDRNTFAHDVGVLTLATPVSSRNFPVLHTDPGAGLSSAEVALWGFGVTLLDGGEPDLNWSGVKKQLIKTVGDCAAFDGRSNTDNVCFDQTSGGGICAGDTGGPTLLTDGPDDLLIGLHAFGDAHCTSFGVDARVSAELDFLGSKVCVRDGACVPICGTLPLPQDPDCAATEPQSDAEVPDAAGPVDGPGAALNDAALDGSEDSFFDVAPSNVADGQSDGASEGGPAPPGDGCACRMSSRREGTSAAASFVAAMACLVRSARRRREPRRRKSR